MGTTFTCVATGDWNDDATWGLTDGDYPGKSGATDDEVIIDVANKSGGSGALTVTLVADVELKAIKMAGTASAGFATLHTASEHTLTLNDTAFSGYSAHVTGQTGFTGNVNFIFTKSGTTHIIIDPAYHTNKLNDITCNHSSLALHLLSAINIKGNLTCTAGSFSTQSSSGGTSHALTVTGRTLINGGTLTCNASTISLKSGVNNNIFGLQVSGGTFNGGTGTHTIGGIRVSGGTLTFTSGNTTINAGETSSSAGAIYISGSPTVNTSSGTVIIDTSSTLQFLLYNSNLTLHNLTINSGSTIRLWQPTSDGSGTELLTVAGDLTINGTLDTDFSSQDDVNVTVTGDCYVAGTLTGNASAISLGSLEVAASGTYNATTGTTTITDEDSVTGYTWDVNGTFNNNDGGVTFDLGSGVDSHIRTGQSDGANSFHNLTVLLNASTNTLTMRPNAGTVMTIEGNLTISEGVLQKNTHSHTLTVTGNVEIHAGGKIDATSASGAMNMGSLTIDAGGTYLATSGTTTITSETGSGYAVEFSGTYTHNSGTLKITTDANTFVKTNDKTYNLVIEAATSTRVYEWVNNTTIQGDLTVNSGRFTHYSPSYTLTVTGDVTTTSGGNLDCGSTTVSMNSLTNEGTFVASSGNTTILVDIRNRTGATFTHSGGTVLVTTGTTYFIHNTGSYSTITFNNLTYSGANCYLVKDIIVEGTFSNPSGYIRLTSGAKITLGTTTSQGTLAMGSNKLLPYATWYLYGASELYPGIVTGTNATPINFSYGEGGANSANLKWLDIQFDIDDVGGDDNYTITLDGSCEFDAVTIDADCTLDLNGQRMTTSGRLSGSGTFTGTNGLLSVADLRTDGFSSFDLQNTDIMFNASCSPRMNGSPSNKARTMFVQSGDVVGMARATTTVNNVIAAGDLRQGNNDQDMALADLTISVGGNLDTQTRTGISYTCSGDFTTSGGLIGLSALETVASSSESASTSANYTVLDNLASCTIEFWLKLTDISNTSARILNVNSGTSGEAYYIRTDGSALQFHLGCLTTDANFSNSDTSLLTLSNVGTKWHHYALVKDNNTVSLYIDGKKVAEKTTSGNTQSANSALVIGKYHGASSNYADMVMDELRFYTDVRTTSEIRDNMFTESPSGDALVGHYKFNEGTGTTVADSSSNSNTLTLSDAGAWAGAGTFTQGTSTVDLTGTGALTYQGITNFNILKVAAATKTTTVQRLSSGDIYINKNLYKGAGTLTRSGVVTYRISNKTGVGSVDNNGTSISGASYPVDLSDTYVIYYHDTSLAKEVKFQFYINGSDTTFQANQEATEYWNNAGYETNVGDYNLKCKYMRYSNSANGKFTMGSGDLWLTNSVNGLQETYPSNTFTVGPGATVSGSTAGTNFKSQNNFSVVGKIENLDVTNEELKVTGQVINCTGDIHQYFPTIDHAQQLDADTADDRDVRLGRDLDKNTELINS